MRLAFLLLLASSIAAFAQDERRVTSPDGQLEFRIFIAEQQDTPLSRIAYQVWSKGQPVVETSFLGLDIYEQEPLLGENEGLIQTIPGKHSDYNSLLARYMQNGSTGRRIDLEVRVYDGAVAFRYIVPRSNMLETIYLADETTEFAVVDHKAIVTELERPPFPAMRLAREEGNIQRVRLERSPENPAIAFQGTAPMVCPWRILIIDRTQESRVKSSLLNPAIEISR